MDSIPNTYNTKIYFEQGGDVLHIGGKIVFDEGAQIEGIDDDDDVEFTPMENQLTSTATTVAALKDDFNALLTKLKDYGFMNPDVPN